MLAWLIKHKLITVLLIAYFVLQWWQQHDELCSKRGTLCVEVSDTRPVFFKHVFVSCFLIASICNPVISVFPFISVVCPQQPPCKLSASLPQAKINTQAMCRNTGGKSVTCSACTISTRMGNNWQND